VRTGNWLDVVDQLTHTSSGGLFGVDGTFAIEAGRIAADDAHARFVDLGQSRTKEELLAHIAVGLSLPKWFGMNWDALDEVLARPDHALSGPILICWPRPDLLTEVDRNAARSFMSVVEAAAAERRDHDNGALLVVVPRDQIEHMSDLLKVAPRLLVWEVDWTSGFDSAWAELSEGSLHAAGLIAAQGKRTYTARYELETGNDFVTRHLSVEARSGSTAKRLDLRLEDGTWSANGQVLKDLELALDCDLDSCPLTNTMPILRHGLHQQPGEVTLSMAFVRLPDLEVVRSQQTYTHLRLLDGGGAVVRYQSAGFEADLVIDSDGFVVEYPKLGARRVLPR